MQLQSAGTMAALQPEQRDRKGRLSSVVYTIQTCREMSQFAKLDAVMYTDAAGCWNLRMNRQGHLKGGAIGAQ